MKKEKVFFKKIELMERWDCSRTTVNNLIKKKAIPYFSPTGAKKVVFPIGEIVKYEQNYTIRKEKKKKKEQPKRKVSSVYANKKWKVSL